jgi:hypothetical protein
MGTNRTETKKKSIKKYYDKIEFKVRKSIVTKDDIQAAAEAAGVSYAAYCTDAILAKMQQPKDTQ